MVILITSDVYMVLLSHAFSTEVEEIMGLLLGYREGQHTVVCSLCVLQRQDKRKDRVEIAEDKMLAALPLGEKITEQIGKSTNVVGWYHSHPHITAFPSDVDTRTQSQYQLMDENFFGLITACFSTDTKTNMNTVDFICFRSFKEPTAFGEKLAYKLFPFHVLPQSQGRKAFDFNLDQLCEIPKIILTEELEAYQNSETLTTGDPLAKMENGSVFSRNVCRIVAGLLVPIIQSMSLVEKETIRENVETSASHNGTKST